MMLSLWTVIALVNSLANAQTPDPGNAVEFPPSFGIAGGLLSGMLGFVDMFDPLHLSPPLSTGLDSTVSPSPLKDSTSADQVALSSPPNPNNVSIHSAEGIAVILPTDLATTLPPSSPTPPRFDISTLLGVTQKPIPRDPFFIDSSLLRRTNLTGVTDSSQSAGQRSGTDADNGLRFNGSVDPLIALFGGLPAQRRDILVKASVNATTTKTTTTATTTIRPVLPTAPLSNQEIFQMLNTFSNRRIVLGKPQGPAKIGNQNSGNRGQGQIHGRGTGLSGKLQ